MTSKKMLLLIKFAIAMTIYNICNVIYLHESFNCISGWVTVLIWQVIAHYNLKTIILKDEIQN